MAVRHYTSSLHDRDGLMNLAFEGIGSMPMAVIERCREERRWALRGMPCTELCVRLQAKGVLTLWFIMPGRCSTEVAAAVRERQAMHNRQELRNTISSKQRTASSDGELAVGECTFAQHQGPRTTTSAHTRMCCVLYARSGRAAAGGHAPQRAHRGAWEARQRPEPAGGQQPKEGLCHPGGKRQGAVCQGTGADQGATTAAQGLNF